MKSPEMNSNSSSETVNSEMPRTINGVLSGLVEIGSISESQSQLIKEYHAHRRILYVVPGVEGVPLPVDKTKNLCPASVSMDL